MTCIPNFAAALARGKKIEAIKIYRTATNCDLREAKNAVEAAIAGCDASHNHYNPADNTGTWVAFPTVEYTLHSMRSDAVEYAKSCARHGDAWSVAKVSDTVKITTIVEKVAQ